MQPSTSAMLTTTILASKVVSKVVNSSRNITSSVMAYARCFAYMENHQSIKNLSPKPERHNFKA